MASGIVAALMVLAAVQVSQTAPPRDAVPRTAVTPDTTSVIRGRVTDRESGQPVARAIVTIRAFPPLTAQQNTSSDAEGHFVFADLAPGRCSLVVNPPANTATYLSQQFGKDRPVDPARVQVPTPIELRAAETKEADIALSKALAIEGRVLGEYGEPLANIRVVAVQAAMPGIMGAASKTTDDRGAFRLFGLTPGEYRVCAEPTENATVIRSPDGDRDPRLRTCYANALQESQGQVVVISSADASGIDIRVQRGRVYTITGVVLTSSGAPMIGGSIQLARADVQGPWSQDVQLTEGRFLARGLISGEYIIRAEIGGPANYQDKREREVGLLRVHVDQADIEGLVLQTAKGAHIEGRLEFEGGVPPNAAATVRVNARPAGNTGIFLAGPQESGTVDENLTFRLRGLLGPHVLQVSALPSMWIVKSIRYKGEDVTGRAVDFKSSSDPRDLVIVLTNRGAIVTGRVDQAGGSAQRATVLFLPNDAANRSPAVLGSIVHAFVADDGTFRLPPIRAGEYLILALLLEDLPPGSVLARPSGIESLASVAERIVLAEHEERSIVLQLVKPR